MLLSSYMASKTEAQPKPAVDSESQRIIEKTASPTKETITPKRVEDAADKFAQRLTEKSAYRNKFREKSPTVGEKAEALFAKMMAKVQEVKDRIKTVTEIVKGRSRKGAEVGTKIEGALADLQKTFEQKSPDEQKAALAKGIELVVAVQAIQRGGEAPQRTEGGRGESERLLLEEQIPITMRIPVSGFVTIRRAGHAMNEQQKFFSEEDLEKYKGSMSEAGGVVVFVDRSGKAWVTGNSPENMKALKDANYFKDGNMKIPFASGEEPSQHITDPSGENYQVKLKRLKDIARARNEEAYAAEQQKIEKKQAA